MNRFSDKLLATPEIARLRRCHEHTVREAIKRGELRGAVKKRAAPGKRLQWYVPENVVKGWRVMGQGMSMGSITRKRG